MVRAKSIVERAILCATCFLLWFATAGAETYDVQCSGDITVPLQAAVSATSDGDTVRITPGSCTTSRPIKWIDKNIAIMGAGMGATTIAAGDNDVFDVAMTTGTAGASSAGTPVLKVSWRISGMTLTGNTTRQTIYSSSIDHRGPIMGWRIDHVKFNYPSYRTPVPRGIMVDGINWGLIDHCNFTGYGFLGVQVRAYLNSEYSPATGAAHEGDYAWSMALNLGSDEAVYIEDSTFSYTTDTNTSTVSDMHSGAAIVLRHSTMTYAFFLAHTGQGGGLGRGGSRKFEVYNNTFHGQSATGKNFIWPMAIQEDGTGVIFNNTVSGYTFNNWVFNLYRAVNNYSGTYYGSCEGAERFTGSGPQSYDGNVEKTGWPCLDQIGRGSGVSIGRAQPSVPVYTWNNGPQITCAAGGACDGSVRVTINGKPLVGGAISQYVTNSRHSNGQVDYCTGITAMPQRCGTHTNAYVSYVYPHPLQGRALLGNDRRATHD